MEEDIKILKNMLDRLDVERFKEYGFVNTVKEYYAIQNLIARNKDLEKNYINPNKARISYFDKGKGTKVVIEGFIPKSKVQEKIEELKNGTYDAKIILQELLED